MTIRLLNAAIIGLLIFTGCTKNDDKNGDNQLPGEINLKNVTLATDKKSFKAGPVTFSGANGFVGGGWQNCVDPDGATIIVDANGFIELASLDFNTLIADVSGLPAIHKVTVKFFNNCCPNLSACDGNNVIANTTEASNDGDNATITLDLSGKKAKKILFQSMEAIVYSVKIE